MLIMSIKDVLLLLHVLNCLINYMEKIEQEHVRQAVILIIQLLNGLIILQDHVYLNVIILMIQLYILIIRDFMVIYQQEFRFVLLNALLVLVFLVKTSQINVFLSVLIIVMVIK
jgi:hypothetical protein